MSDDHSKPPDDPIRAAQRRRQQAALSQRGSPAQRPTADAFPSVGGAPRAARSIGPGSTTAPPQVREQVALELVLPDGEHLIMLGHTAWPPRPGALTVHLAAAPTNPAPVLAALAAQGQRRRRAADEASRPGARNAGHDPTGDARPSTAASAAQGGSEDPQPQRSGGAEEREPRQTGRQSRVRRGGAAASQLQQPEMRGPKAPAFRPTNRQAPEERAPEGRAPGPARGTELPEASTAGSARSSAPSPAAPTAEIERAVPSTPSSGGTAGKVDEPRLLDDSQRKPRTRAKTVEVPSQAPIHDFDADNATPAAIAKDSGLGQPVGIDFGSSYCRVGVFRGGLELISDTHDRLHIPASVPPPASAPATDRGAGAHGYSGLPADSIRWLLGLGSKAPAALAASGGPPAELGPSGTVLLELGGAVVSVKDLCTALLRTLRRQAARHLANPVRQVVLTIPATWGPDQRRALEAAAHAAGLTQITFIADPVAALIGHGLRGKQGLIAVYNLGGSFEFTLLEGSGSTFRVLCSGADPWLGGRELDAALARILADSFGPKLEASALAGIDPRAALGRAAERAKRALTAAEAVDVRLPLTGGDEIRATITRQQLERAAMPLLGRSLLLVEQVLERAGVSAPEVTEVVLTGGCALVPLVRRTVTKHFGRSPRVGDADLAVVRGAALHAAELIGTSAAHRIVRPRATATALKLAVQVEGGTTHTICERGSPLPLSQRIALKTTRDGQTELMLVLRAEEPDTGQTRLLARLRYTGLPAAPAGSVKLDALFWAQDADEINVSVTMGTQLFRSAVSTVRDEPSAEK